MGLVQPFPRRRLGARDERAVGSTNVPGEPVLQVLAQPVIAYQLRCLRALGGLLRLPLRHHGAVDRLAGPGRGIAAELTRNGPRSRPIVRAISRTPFPCALSNAISSRSANDR